LLNKQQAYSAKVIRIFHHREEGGEGEKRKKERLRFFTTENTEITEEKRN
jgi:hypothetical protein